MTEHSPITPPPELMLQWRGKAPRYRREEWLIERAAQWGYDKRGEVNEAKLEKARDQELDACCEWMLNAPFGLGLNTSANQLRAARRPKPPSLKEQALEALDDAVLRGDCITISDALPTIRRALEQLDD